MSGGLKFPMNREDKLELDRRPTSLAKGWKNNIGVTTHLTPALSPPSDGAEREERSQRPDKIDVRSVSGFNRRTFACLRFAAETKSSALKRDAEYKRVKINHDQNV
jgi:hypothetical protein